MELTDGVGADIVFLGFGDAPTIQQAVEICRRGGQLVQHALMEDGIAFPYRVHQPTTCTPTRTSSSSPTP